MLHAYILLVLWIYLSEHMFISILQIFIAVKKRKVGSIFRPFPVPPHCCLAVCVPQNCGARLGIFHIVD